MMSAVEFQQSAEWRHVVAMYGQPGIAQACLLLQDRLGVDVLVMLHLGYLCRQHRCPLQESQISAADAVVKDWREQVVKPLRAARRAIAKDNADTQALRTAVQQAELAAERHALALLAAVPAVAEPATTVGAASPTTLVAAFYARRSGCTPELQTAEIQSAIQLLDLAWAFDRP